MLQSSNFLSHVGKLLPFSETACDVAVAKLESVIQKGKSKFKTRQGTPVHCKIFEKRSAEEKIPGSVVHIWGASTAPGIGKITSDDFSYLENPSVTYILVENYDERNFCSKGDSGSIVCSNNNRERYVNAISVLSGLFESREAETTVLQYLTYPIKASLEDLSKRYGKNFRILNEKDEH